MPHETTRSPEIPAPSREPLTYQGRKITPGAILDLWKKGQAQKQKSRERILTCRQYRRMDEETLVRLSSRWARLYPEATAWVVEALEERVTLDRTMVARVGAVEPEFTVAPIATEDVDPFTKTAHDLAEAREAYLEEWRQSPFGPPTQAFFGKGCEDGEYARVTLPAELDMDGCPTFFETLSDDAYAAADAREQRQYVEDEDTPTRLTKRGKTRYVKVDESGAKQLNPKYRGAKDDAAMERHKADIRRYLLDKPASVTRLIPALDCAPIFTRGKGRSRWELTALVERTLYYVDELLEAEYAWQGMGDRQFVPLAYDANGTRMSVASSDVGDGGQVYLYTAYLVCRDKAGHKRPIIAYTVGGAATSYGTGSNPDDPEAVGLIDLYQEYGLEGPFWSYHGGLHTEDDDSDHYWQPYIWPLIRRMKTIEGNKTSINAATHVNSFSGQYYRPDAAIAALENADEFLLESDGELRRPKISRAGELEPAVGEIFSAPPPQIGPDAWRQLQVDMESLRAATAIDQTSTGQGASGAALVTEATIGAVAKRHIREGTLDAVVRSGEDHLKILDAIHNEHGVAWPLQTVEERPVGEETRRGVRLAEYDPRWIGDGNFRLHAEYPEEENLARIDLEANLADRGYGSRKRVHKAMGEKDSDRAQLESDKDRLMKHPAVDALRMMRVAKKIGDRELLEIAKLQAQELMAPEVPEGITGGVPTAGLRRKGETAGQGGPTVAASMRGGMEAGALAGATAQADAEAAMTQQGAV